MMQAGGTTCFGTCLREGRIVASVESVIVPVCKKGFIQRSFLKVKSVLGTLSVDSDQLFIRCAGEKVGLQWGSTSAVYTL